MNQYDDFAYDQTLGLSSSEAVTAIGNRYDLILIASRRVRELNRGDMPKLKCRRGTTLTALKEIEFGKVGKSYLYKELDPVPSKRSRKWT